MVAFRRAVALASACFILGVVLLALPTLFPILFPSSTPTQADYDRVERYFAAWWSAPVSVKMLLHADIGVCILACTTKLATWSEAAYYFDGSSLLLLIGGVSLYVGAVIPGLRMLHPESKPSSLLLLDFLRREAKHEAASLLNPSSDAARIEPLTPPQRLESLGIVSAAVVLIGLVLLGIVGLQVGDWIAEKIGAQSRALFEEDERKRAAIATREKAE